MFPVMCGPKWWCQYSTQYISPTSLLKINLYYFICIFLLGTVKSPCSVNTITCSFSLFVSRMSEFVVMVATIDRIVRGYYIISVQIFVLVRLRYDTDKTLLCKIPHTCVSAVQIVMKMLCALVRVLHCTASRTVHPNCDFPHCAITHGKEPVSLRILHVL